MATDCTASAKEFPTAPTAVVIGTLFEFGCAKAWRAKAKVTIFRRLLEQRFPLRTRQRVLLLFAATHEAP